MSVTNELTGFLTNGLTGFRFFLVGEICEPRRATTEDTNDAIRADISKMEEQRVSVTNELTGLLTNGLSAFRFFLVGGIYEPHSATAEDSDNAIRARMSEMQEPRSCGQRQQAARIW